METDHNTKLCSAPTRQCHHLGETAEIFLILTFIIFLSERHLQILEIAMLRRFSELDLYSCIFQHTM